MVFDLASPRSSAGRGSRLVVTEPPCRLVCPYLTFSRPRRPAATLEALVVLLVGDGVGPLGGAAHAHRHVRHRAVRPAAVVVPLVRWDVDPVAWEQYVALAAPRADPPAAAHAEQELPARVPVPVGPGTRREVHHRHPGALRPRQTRAQPHPPAEPAVVALLVRTVVSVGDLHRRVPLRRRQANPTRALAGMGVRPGCARSGAAGR